MFLINGHRRFKLKNDLTESQASQLIIFLGGRFFECYTTFSFNDEGKLADKIIRPAIEIQNWESVDPRSQLLIEMMLD
jgi:hypothetical protein